MAVELTNEQAKEIAEALEAFRQTYEEGGGYTHGAIMGRLYQLIELVKPQD